MDSSHRENSAEKPRPFSAPKSLLSGGPIAMIGKFDTEKSSFTGIWAMSRAELKQKGKNEPFELILETRENSSWDEKKSNHLQWEVQSGTYSGHFFLREATGRKQVSDFCKLFFCENSTGGANLEGKGRNVYGPYNITGVIEPTFSDATNCSSKMWRVPIAEDQVGSILPPPCREDRMFSAKAPRMHEKDADSRKAAENRPNIRELLTTTADEIKLKNHSTAKIERDAEAKNDEKWKEACFAIHEDLCERSEAIRWFNKPVDPILNNAPNYLEIIRNPIDLGTIKTKLTQGAYNSTDEFVEDVKLVFSNAKLYTPDAKSDIHKDAVKLESRLDKLVKMYVEKSGDCNQSNHGEGRKSKNEAKRSSVTKARDAELPAMKESEMLKLQQNINELFRNQETHRDLAFACAVWQLLLACVNAADKKQENDHFLIPLESIPVLHLYQLSELISRWINLKTTSSPTSGLTGPESSENVKMVSSANRRSRSISNPWSEGEDNQNGRESLSEGNEKGKAAGHGSAKGRKIEENVVAPIVMPLVKVIEPVVPPADIGAALDENTWDIDSDENLGEENDEDDENDWSIARQEKAERERRKLERQRAEDAVVKAQEEVVANREAELRRDIEAASKRAAALELARKEQAKKSKADAKASEEKDRQDQQRKIEQLDAEVDLDEVRGNKELMKLMNGAL